MLVTQLDVLSKGLKMDAHYRDIFLRNKGYVADDVQKIIRDTKILIAGCGVGSTIAEAAVRIGFDKVTLADGDTVEAHNLNRQAFSYHDVGGAKVVGLAKRLRAINPRADIEEIDKWISKDNTKDLVSSCDLIFDTIDFLDLKTIVGVHDEANVQNKPIISAVSAGWGAAAIYFPPNHAGACGFRTLFGLPESGSVENASYVHHFAAFMQRLGAHLDPAVAQAMAKALTVMEDGTPCPAPHVSAGSYAVASLAVTMAFRILAGQKVLETPYLVLADMGQICAQGGIDLTP